jgi:tripartite ATP-independent transporter DctM subunit
MSQQFAGAIGIALMFVLMSVRVPVAVSMMVGAGFGYTLLDGWQRTFYVLAALPQQLGTEYTLSVVPLFVLMGALASRMGFSGRLFKGASALFSRLKASSAMATIGASALFGAICGSSLATTATIGKIAIPEMRRQGYKDYLTAGAIASGGSLGILIPPSIILVLYGLIAEQSVGQLFASAMIPGLILTALYLLITQIIAHIDPSSAADGEVLPLRERLQRILGMWEIVVIFGLSIGGLYAGLFTPTEAAAVGAVTALLLGVLGRKLSLSDIWDALGETLLTTATLFFVALGATFFAYFVIQAQIPIAMTEYVQSLNASPIVVMALIVIFYIVAGTFLEGIGMVLATVPVFLPLIVSLGYDPLWFGVLVVVLVEMGFMSSIRP